MRRDGGREEGDKRKHKGNRIEFMVTQLDMRDDRKKVVRMIHKFLAAYMSPR